MLNPDTILTTVFMATSMIGVIMGVVQFRNLVKTRRIQLYMELQNRLNDKEMQRVLTEVLVKWKWKDTDDFFKKYGPESNLDEFIKFTTIITYLENIGLFVKEKLVDKDWVVNLLDYMILDFWEKYEPIIVKMGEPYNNLCITPMTKYLYDKIKLIHPQYT